MQLYICLSPSCKSTPVIDFCLDYAKLVGVGNLMNALIPAMSGEQSQPGA